MRDKETGCCIIVDLNELWFVLFSVAAIAI